MRLLVLVLLAACSGAKAEPETSEARCKAGLREFYASGHWFNGSNGRRMDDEYPGGRRYSNGHAFVTIDEVINVMCPPLSVSDRMPRLYGYYVSD